MAQDYGTFSVAINDPGADDKLIPVLEAAADVFGGGLTVLWAKAEVHTSVTNSQGAGGTTFTLQLMKRSAEGTPAVNGTVSTNIVGGTAEGWTAGVPHAFTIDPDYAFLDAGESLVVDYQEINSGSPSGNVIVYGGYVRGK